MADDKPQDGGFINLGGADCPKCSQRQPTFRVPSSLHQLMWGGWTCPNCGCEMDKWGRPIGQDDTTGGGES